MKGSTKVSAGVAAALAAMLLLALGMFNWQVLDQRFHMLSPHMADVAATYEFRLLGLFLLVAVPFIAMLWVIWWLGRKMKVPHVVLLLVCLALIAIGYFCVASLLKGTIRG
jgi:hypothetical protein